MLAIIFVIQSALGSEIYFHEIVYSFEYTSEEQEQFYITLKSAIAAVRKICNNKNNNLIKAREAFVQIIDLFYKKWVKSASIESQREMFARTCSVIPEIIKLRDSFCNSIKWTFRVTNDLNSKDRQRIQISSVLGNSDELKRIVKFIHETDIYTSFFKKLMYKIDPYIRELYLSKNKKHKKLLKKFLMDRFDKMWFVAEKYFFNMENYDKLINGNYDNIRKQRSFEQSTEQDPSNLTDKTLIGRKRTVQTAGNLPYCKHLILSVTPNTLRFREFFFIHYAVRMKHIKEEIIFYNFFLSLERGYYQDGKLYDSRTMHVLLFIHRKILDEYTKEYIAYKRSDRNSETERPECDEAKGEDINGLHIAIEIQIRCCERVFAKLVANAENCVELSSEAE